MPKLPLDRYVLMWTKSLRGLEERAEQDPGALVVFGMHSPWWKVGVPRWRIPGTSIPCDPRGGMLMQSHGLRNFLNDAKTNPAYYGRHGLVAFMAAHDRNLCLRDGRTTCLQSWDQYNELLDHDLRDLQNGKPNHQLDALGVSVVPKWHVRCDVCRQIKPDDETTWLCQPDGSIRIVCKGYDNC